MTESFEIKAYWDDGELPADPEAIQSVLDSLGMRIVKGYCDGGADYYIVKYTSE